MPGYRSHPGVNSSVDTVCPPHTTTIWTQSNSTVSSPGFLKVNCTARASGASPNCAAYDKGSRRIGPGLPGAGVNFPSADDSYPELNCLNQTGVDYAKAGGGLSPAVLEDYRAMITRLYMYGIPVFLVTGSFLSQHRDCGHWNANDHDLDLGIFADDLYRLPSCSTPDGVNNLIKHALYGSMPEKDRVLSSWGGFKCTEKGLPFQLYEKGKVRCSVENKPGM